MVRPLMIDCQECFLRKTAPDESIEVTRKLNLQANTNFTLLCNLRTAKYALSSQNNSHCRLRFLGSGAK